MLYLKHPYRLSKKNVLVELVDAYSATTLHESLDKTDRALSAAIMQHAPGLAKPKLEKNRLKWVARAVQDSKLTDRTYLKYLSVQNGKVYGTDGHRAHWIKDSNIHEDGQFIDTSNWKDVKVLGNVPNYPDVKQVIARMKEIDVAEFSPIYTPLVLHKGYFLYEIKGEQYKTYARREYMLDAVEKKTPIKVKLIGDSNKVSVKYIGPNHGFVVMGYRPR